jgi:hypothetical protein
MFHHASAIDYQGFIYALWRGLVLRLIMWENQKAAKPREVTNYLLRCSSYFIYLGRSYASFRRGMGQFFIYFYFKRLFHLTFSK